jgi:Mycothiol maleylpyruvate isomerase N-terminal domain
MSEIREAFLDAARSAARVLAAPEVARAWDQQSALSEFPVSGLCGHLANQVFTATSALQREPLDETPIPLLGHYFRANWIDAAIDDVVNVGIRETGSDVAADGPADLVERVESQITELSWRLPGEPENRVINVGSRWNLTLEDYLITRMMEIAVHSDDVAVSVNIEAPTLPPIVLDPVLELLTKLSLHKHGQAALLRALARKERAPADITAF